MYVQCERCSAEYEFDDALVSERGTTVKCTSCGHQFKIRRETSGTGDGDRWIVTTTDGRSLTFSSLKELQRAIVAKSVGRNDQLSRSNMPPKPLGSIAELEPFFEDGRPRQPSFQDRPQLMSSTRPPPAPNFQNTLPPPGASAGLAAPRQKMRSTQPSIPPPLPPRATSGRPPPPAAATTAAAATSASTSEPAGPLAPLAKAEGPWSGDDTPTHAIRRDPPAAPPPAAAKREEAPKNGRATAPTPMPRPEPAVVVASPPAVERTAPLPPGTNERARERVSASDALRGPSPSLYDANHGPGGKRVGGWVVGLALLTGVAAVGFYMVNRARNEGAGANGAAAEVDPRVQQFLSTGERALAQGNLDLAKENLDKASALAERNPDVLLATARLAAARADLAWLRQKLAVPDTDEARINKQSLDDLSAAARRAADEAQKTAPNDPVLIRARIDALRISGDTQGARALVDKILPTGSQPETAYVLAALDLAESDPPWSVVLSRLRTAAAGEGSASRARAALVYALARSGNAAEARSELERLAAQPRVHPLLPALRSFVDRTAPQGAADAGAAAKPDAGVAVAAVDVNHLPNQASAGGATPTTPATTPTPAKPAGETPQGGGGTAATPAGGSSSGASATGALPSDPRTLLRMADAAKNKRDFDRARMLYEATLAKSPNDSEALAGLGDVSRAQGDSAGAQSLYKRALGVNPSYLPALIGLADLAWEGGDKAGAQKQYREIVDRFPEPAYPARVKQRAEGTP